MIPSPILSLLVFTYYDVNVPGQVTLWNRLSSFNQTFRKWTSGLKYLDNTKTHVQRENGRINTLCELYSPATLQGKNGLHLTK